MNKYYFNPYLLISLIGIMSFGIIMVSSASIPIAEQYSLPMLYFSKKQLTSMLIGIFLLLFTTFIPIKLWEKYIYKIFPIVTLFLIIILIPGLGREVNGSTRWIRLIFFDIQISEFTKLFYILFLAKYLNNNQEKIDNLIIGFIQPMFFVGIVSILLLLEPDFGTTVVLVLTTLWMLFLAGAKIKNFAFLSIFISSLISLIAVSSPYRLKRLVAFLDPWQDQFNTGYQLTQSLIAFGQGGIFGTGIGKSIQKLLYLPEAHTDFILSVIAEELGIIGVIALLLTISFLIYQIFKIAKQAKDKNMTFASYTCLGIAIWLSVQTMINVGVTTGMLPTKGITLPFVSYGGNSLLSLCISIGIVIRIDFELRYKLKNIIVQSKFY